jgi:hypothetical protein
MTRHKTAVGLISQRRDRPLAVIAVRAVWVTTLALCCTPALAAELHVDTFDATVQGWAGGAVPTHVATGGAGDGGGFLMISVGSNLATHNSEARWIGDLASVGAALVRVDLMAPTTSEPLAMRLVLFGPNSTSDRWTSTIAQTVPNDGVWRNYIFGLSASELVAPVAPSGTHAELMTNTLRVMLRHDPDDPDFGGTFVDGSLGIDNIELAAAPAPDIPGDFDGDGAVDGDDLNGEPLGWRVRFGDDLEGNDFLEWQRHLGEPGNMATAAPAGVVPEPGTLALVLTAAALGTCRRSTQITRP